MLAHTAGERRKHDARRANAPGRPFSSPSAEPLEARCVSLHFQLRRLPKARQHVSDAEQCRPLSCAPPAGAALPNPGHLPPSPGEEGKQHQQHRDVGRCPKAAKTDGPYLHLQRVVTLRVVGDAGVGGGAPVTLPPGREAAGASEMAKVP